MHLPLDRCLSNMPGHVDTWQYDIRLGSRTFHLYRKRKARVVHPRPRAAWVLLAVLLWILVSTSLGFHPHP